jgi:signal transduction histidine kinase
MRDEKYFLVFLSMQKRAAELKGQFEFRPKAGEGTIVKLEFGL